MNSANNQNEINVGVDTGKTQLDIYIRPLDIYFTISNDELGVKKALIEIKKHDVSRIIIEATVGLQYTFVSACAKANLGSFNISGRNFPLNELNPLILKKSSFTF